MTVTVYRWDDASAPTLSGTVGSLIGVLDACLVNGYGAKAAAGWAKAFTGTNKAAYRPATGNRFYLQVLDDGSTSGIAANTAAVRGYETMSSVDTGTKPFPTISQVAVVNSGWYKSNTADATTRPWIVVADGVRFHIWIGYNASSAAALSASSSSQQLYFFGDLVSRKSGDVYATHILCHYNNAAGSNVGGGIYRADENPTVGSYIARPFYQMGSSTHVIRVGANDLIGYTNAVGTGAVTSPYPDPIQGGILLHKVDIFEKTLNGGNNSVIRGLVPGLWSLLQNLPASNGDTFDGAGALAGKTFMLLDCMYAGSRARVAIEISDTWPTTYF